MNVITVRNGWLVPALRLALGGVFIYAGATKIIDAQAFSDGIFAFQIFPIALINILALVIPPFEILLGLLVWSGFRLRSVAFTLVLLIFGFLFLLVSSELRGIKVECGCFGNVDPPWNTPWFAILRDIPLLIGAIFLYLQAIGKEADT